MSPSPNPRRDAIVELALVVGAPTVILVFLSGEDRLGPVRALLLALAFPIGHAIWGVARTRKVSAVSVIVFASVLLTGGIGLLELDARWFALKEGAVTLAMGLLVLASTWTRWSVLGVLLDTLLDAEALRAALAKTGRADEWPAVVRRGNVRLAGVMAIAAVGTMLLARALVTSPSGTPEFAEQLGRYTAISLPAVSLPMMGLTIWVLKAVLDGVERVTGVPVDDLLRPEMAEKAKE